MDDAWALDLDRLLSPSSLVQKVSSILVYMLQKLERSN